jgi:hypothetical protein
MEMAARPSSGFDAAPRQYRRSRPRLSDGLHRPTHTRQRNQPANENSQGPNGKAVGAVAKIGFRQLLSRRRQPHATGDIAAATEGGDQDDGGIERRADGQRLGGGSRPRLRRGSGKTDSRAEGEENGGDRAGAQSTKNDGAPLNGAEAGAGFDGHDGPGGGGSGSDGHGLSP